MSEGRIRKALSGFYYVDTGSEVLTCRARGKFRKEGISPLVGDRVEVRELGNGEGFVEAILPRKNAFSRPAVANIDQLVVIASGAIPKTDPFLIDRVAAIAALKGCSVMVLLNKCDLDCADALYAVYAAAGFPTLRVSAETGEGIEELKPLIAGKLSAFTGNSGVGKSSILNALDPAFQLQVGDVSQALGRGRHTTRHVELFHLSCGADVVDSPGFSSFETDELNLELKHRLPETFVEFRPYLDQCRFVGCSHTKEKGCAVLEAAPLDLASAHRLQHGAALFNRVRTACKFAGFAVLRKFRKTAGQFLLADHLIPFQFDGRKARRIGYVAVSKRIQLHMARRMPPAAELAAGFTRGDRKTPVEPVEQARFTNAGVSGKRGDTAGG